jgi:hypothetical protein
LGFRSPLANIKLNFYNAKWVTESFQPRSWAMIDTGLSGKMRVI